MDKLVNSIADRLSLRQPLRENLEILSRVTNIVPPAKDRDMADILLIIQSEYPTVTDFEHDFPLAPSLLEKDKYDNWIINKAYNPAMLAEAVCTLEGFTYEPSDGVYWIHGKSSESDYIYVTTQTLNNKQLAALSDEVGKSRTLLIMCGAFRAKAGGFSNLTIKKIPNSVLAKCEWGHDDYSLQVENLPLIKKPPKKQGELFEEKE
jgi:adenine-specific DNA-methyltransferase